MITKRVLVHVIAKNIPIKFLITPLVDHSCTLCNHVVSLEWIFTFEDVGILFLISFTLVQGCYDVTTAYTLNDLVISISVHAGYSVRWF
jgi:hypothetical protein